MTHPLRIAYFAGTMRHGHDGVTRVLYRLIDNLNAREVPALFFSPIVPPEGERPVPMVQVPSVTFPLYKDYKFALPGSVHFERQLREFRPDILHINSPCPLGHAAVHYGRRHGIPVVATYHTHFPSYAKYYKIRALEMFSWSYLRKLYNGCERVYVPSRPILSELAGHGMLTVDFLPHGVDASVFHPRFRSARWKEAIGASGKTVVLFAGRLVWEKDLATFAQAYALVSSQRSDVAFVLVGDGPIREELRRMMPDAIFAGYRTGEDLSRAFASADIFAFPSTTETFGNVTVEAMASGVPPICAREGGAYGFVDHGVTGLLTAPRDPLDLANAIMHLVDHPEQRAAMAAKALTFARAQSWDAIFDRLHASYQEVVETYVRGTRRRRRVAA